MRHPRLLVLAAPLLLGACPDDPDPVEPAPDAGDTFCRDVVAFGSFDPLVPPQLWRLGRGEPVLLAPHDEADFAVSPDASRLAIARPFAVHVMDLVTGDTTVVPVDGTPSVLDWTAKLPTAVVDGFAFIVDPIARTTTLASDQGRVAAARLAASGTSLVVQRYDENRLYVIALPTGDARVVAEDAVAMVGPIGDTVTYEVRHAAGTHAINRVNLAGLRVDSVPVPHDSRDFASLGWGHVASVDRVAGYDQLTLRTLSSGDDVRAQGAGIELMSWTDAGLMYTVREPRPALWFHEVSFRESHLMAEGTWQAAVALGYCR